MVIMSNLGLKFMGENPSGNAQPIKTYDDGNVGVRVNEVNSVPLYAPKKWGKNNITIDDIEASHDSNVKVYKMTATGAFPSARALAWGSMEGVAPTVKLDKRFKRLKLGVHLYEVNNAGAKLEIRQFNKDRTTVSTTSTALTGQGWKEHVVELRTETVDVSLRLIPGEAISDFVVVSDFDVTYLDMIGEKKNEPISLIVLDKKGNEVELTAELDNDGKAVLRTVNAAPHAYDEGNDSFKTVVMNDEKSKTLFDQTVTIPNGEVDIENINLTGFKYFTISFRRTGGDTSADITINRMNFASIFGGDRRTEFTYQTADALGYDFKTDYLGGATVMIPCYGDYLNLKLKNANATTYSGYFVVRGFK